ncbi:MAG: hypothetical protein RLZZ414_563 [Bacteroidota bacterium]
MKQIRDLFTSIRNQLKMKDTLITKITGGGTFLGIILGEITQETTLKLSAISYIVGITLGLITIIIKLCELYKSLKNK